jgi:hypothetical protein
MFPMYEKWIRDGKNISTIIFLTEEFITPKIQRHSRTVQKAKTKDMGVFTLHISQSSVRENKSVKSVTHYLKDYVSSGIEVAK